jgi:hypothetical protein
MLGFAYAFYGKSRVEALNANLRENLSSSTLRAQKPNILSYPAKMTYQHDILACYPVILTPWLCQFGRLHCQIGR